MSEVIDSFKGEHDFLSNFYPVEIIFDGRRYKSVEHAYQAAKTDDEWWRKKIRFSTTAREAKQYGRECPLRADWEEVKLSVMEDLLRQKFGHPELAIRLDQTYPAELVEGNWWGDTYWGVCKGEGENNLGKLLMQIRSEIE